jgi:hypothetical protein
VSWRVSAESSSSSSSSSASSSAGGDDGVGGEFAYNLLLLVVVIGRESDLDLFIFFIVECGVAGGGLFGLVVVGLGLDL